jgi:hypothetical protein
MFVCFVCITQLMQIGYFLALPVMKQGLPRLVNLRQLNDISGGFTNVCKQS